MEWLIAFGKVVILFFGLAAFVGAAGLLYYLHENFDWFTPTLVLLGFILVFTTLMRFAPLF